MSDVPENAPEACPGTSSDQAGKSSACAGCPNQQLCATAPKGPDPAIAQIAERLKSVKHKVLVLSGKGGVGKSTFSTQLAFALANSNKQVGLLDVDICGPSVPRMTGMEGETVHQSNLGWSPVYPQDNLGVLSIGFLLDNPDEAVVWKGPKKNGMIKQFLKDVYWGDELDVMIVDCPPGTSDEHLSLTTYLQTSDVDGAIIVSTPQEVALVDVKKEISFCRKTKLPIIGVVENMSGFACPKCHVESPIFPPTTKGAEQLAVDMGVPFLGRVPLDPAMMQACEEGRPYLPGSVDDEEEGNANSGENDSAAQAAFRAVVAEVHKRVLGV
eukprot:JP446409.1.p1 GENE.JP446409.1~~JP446409.1.p1  ORF type:complete len:334 (+),score=35.95 JP446409.1:24-1004(+)